MTCILWKHTSLKKVYKMDQQDSSFGIELNRKLAAMLRVCQAAKAVLEAEVAALRVEIATLRESNTRQEIINQELGQKVQTQTEQLEHQADEKWHVNMEKVSFRRVSTPEKKVLSALYDIQRDTPQTIRGDYKVTERQLMEATGMSKSTLWRHMNSVETKGLISTREESGQGRQRYVKVDTAIMRNPFAIHKIVPVDRTEKRGGLREEKPVCFNCGSTRVRGYRHDCLECTDCGWSTDDREIYEIEQTIDQADTAEMPTVRLPVVKPRLSLPITPLPATVSPPGPDELCANCHRPRSVCWYPSRVAAGQWSASCQDHLVRKNYA